MKSYLPIILLSASLCAAEAQIVGGGTPDPSTWTVTERDWCSSVREFTESATNLQTGEIAPRTRTITEFGTGLNYLDQGGHWRRSMDLIELTPDGGAAAVHGPHKVYFSPDGAVTLITRSNHIFQTRVRGVYFFDAQSGRSNLLAAPQAAATAELHPPNQIVYRSALDSGGFKADLRYTYTKAGLESDVLITHKPKLSPAACGLNPDTTRLQVQHEWVNAPLPRINQRIVERGAGPDLVDQTLDFGEVWLPAGRAFAWDGSSSTDTNVAAEIDLANPAAGGAQVAVGKEWRAGGTLSTLTESVNWSSVAPKLAQLPEIAMADANPDSSELADRGREGRAAARVFPGKREVRMAGLPRKQAGVVLDYIFVTGSGDYTFATYVPGTANTYWLSANGYFYGTLTFQPGCVLRQC